MAYQQFYLQLITKGLLYALHIPFLQFEKAQLNEITDTCHSQQKSTQIYWDEANNYAEAAN